MRNKLRILQIILLSASLVLIGVFIASAAINSEQVSRVTVRFIGDDEPKDMVVPLSEERLPDYRLDLIARGEKYRCGSFPNTSARDGLTFAVAETIPLDRLQEIVLLEDDPLANDVLARVQAQASPLATADYVFEVEASRSFGAGMIWFFDTPIGKAISAGITIVVILLLLALVAPLFEAFST